MKNPLVNPMTDARGGERRMAMRGKERMSQIRRATQAWLRATLTTTTWMKTVQLQRVYSTSLGGGGGGGGGEMREGLEGSRQQGERDRRREERGRGEMREGLEGRRQRREREGERKKEGER